MLSITKDHIPQYRLYICQSRQTHRDRKKTLRVWGMKECRVTACMYRVSLKSDENVLKLDYGDGPKTSQTY